MRITSTNIQKVPNAPQAHTTKGSAKNRTRLDELREQIHNGTYVVDKKALADAIIKYELGAHLDD